MLDILLIGPEKNNISCHMKTILPVTLFRMNASLASDVAANEWEWIMKCCCEGSKARGE